jgi:hypothetical protein
MPRSAKQFFYGLLYLCIIGAIGTGIYFRYLKPVPSCFDGVQNQGEQGVDCGPVCGNLCTADLAPITAIGPVYVFPGTQGRVTVAAEIANPNSDFGASDAPYTFTLYDASHIAIGTILGASFVYPGQTKYVAVVNQPMPAGAVSATLTMATGTVWAASSTMGAAPQFAFQNLATSDVASGTVVASGLLVNQENVPFAHIQIVTFFESEVAQPIGVSETELDNVAAGGSVPVSVSYPADPRIDMTHAEMYAYALR